MRELKDERVTSQVRKYGYESFIVLSSLLMGFVFLKIFIFDVKFSEIMEVWVLLLVGFVYFTIRFIVGGTFSMPPKINDKEIFTKRLIIGNAIVSLIWSILVATRSVIRYQDGSIGWLSIIIMIISMVSFFVVISLANIVIYGLSNRQANKDMKK